MTRSKSDLDDLKDMQREAEGLREKQKLSRADTAPEDGGKTEPEKGAGTAKASKPGPGAADKSEEPDKEGGGVAAHVDSVVQELEVLAREHPSLALASAFTVGFFVGKLFSRR